VRGAHPVGPIAYCVVVVVVFEFDVVTATGGYVVVLVTLSSATPLLLRYVVEFESVCVPSELVLLWLRVVLSVPTGGAMIVGVTIAGVTVVVVCDDDDVCAMATPIVITSAAVAANNTLLISCSPITERRGGLPGVVAIE
jgi:hypothetical protein